MWSKIWKFVKNLFGTAAIIAPVAIATAISFIITSTLYKAIIISVAAAYVIGIAIILTMEKSSPKVQEDTDEKANKSKKTAEKATA